MKLTLYFVSGVRGAVLRGAGVPSGGQLPGQGAVWARFPSSPAAAPGLRLPAAGLQDPPGRSSPGPHALHVH